jgi:hypothetical protein
VSGLPAAWSPLTDVRMDGQRSPRRARAVVQWMM